MKKMLSLPMIAVIKDAADLEILQKVFSSQTSGEKVKSSKPRKMRKGITRNMPKGIIRGTETGKNYYINREGKQIFTVDNPRTGDWELNDVKRPNRKIYISRKEKSKDAVRVAANHILKCTIQDTRIRRFKRQQPTLF